MKQLKINVSQTVLASIFLILLSSFSNGFKTEQMRFPRVRNAYKAKEKSVISNLQLQEINTQQLRIYIRIFKSEKLVELWGKNQSDKKYKLVKTFDICASSGTLGPKRQQGDYQVPEGYYHINRFNPYSNFLLSLGLNYPNPSDRILGNKNRLGGDIFIHGSCVTVGCVPLQDSFIQEFYIYCVEAKNAGQGNIPVTVFPKKLNETNWNQLKTQYKNSPQVIGLWQDLKKGYDYFNENKSLPNVRFLNSGRHEVGN